MNKKEDLYIEVLNFGKDNIGRPFRFTDLEIHLKSKGYMYEEFALRQFFAALFISLENPSGNNPSYPINLSERFFLQNSGYFSLLDYTELQSARKSSKEAMYFAIIAIIISIISTCFSIYYSNKQLNTPTVIRQDQLELLKLKNTDSIIIELKNLRNSMDRNKKK